MSSTLVFLPTIPITFKGLSESFLKNRLRLPEASFPGLPTVLPGV